MYEYNRFYQPQPQQQGILWVQGESGAKSWLVAPNNTVLLMDSESPRFYIKSADGAGMPTLKVYEYHEAEIRPQSVPTVANDNYCTKEEYKGLEGKIDDVVARLEAIEKKNRRVKENDE